MKYVCSSACRPKRASRHQNINNYFPEQKFERLKPDLAINIDKCTDHSPDKIPRHRQAPRTQAVAPLSCEQSLQTLQRSIISVPWSVKCTRYKICGYSLSSPPLDRETVQN